MFSAKKLDVSNFFQICRLFNANHVPITVVRTHPQEKAIITGDETGKIFLWREFMSKNSVKTVGYEHTYMKNFL